VAPSEEPSLEDDELDSERARERPSVCDTDVPSVVVSERPSVTEVERPRVTETTALGAAYLAGLGAGCFSSLEDVARQWVRDRRFEPALAVERRGDLYRGWLEAVARVRSH